MDLEYALEFILLSKETINDKQKVNRLVIARRNYMSVCLFWPGVPNLTKLETIVVIITY